MEIKLNNVRLAFPELFKPKAFGAAGEGEPAYSCTLLIDGADAAQVKAVKDALVQCAKDKWADKAPVVFKSLTEGNKLCAYSGDRKAEYAGFAGNFVVACRSKTKPLTIDRARRPVEEGALYPGCYVNAVVAFWAQDNKYGKRINCEIKGVQFVKDGDSFGGGGAPAKPDDFAPLDDAGDGGSDMFGDADFGG